MRDSVDVRTVRGFYAALPDSDGRDAANASARAVRETATSRRWAFAWLAAFCRTYPFGKLRARVRRYMGKRPGLVRLAMGRMGVVTEPSWGLR